MFLKLVQSVRNFFASSFTTVPGTGKSLAETQAKAGLNDEVHEMMITTMKQERPPEDEDTLQVQLGKRKNADFNAATSQTSVKKRRISLERTSPAEADAGKSSMWNNGGMISRPEPSVLEMEDVAVRDFAPVPLPDRSVSQILSTSSNGHSPEPTAQPAHSMSDPPSVAKDEVSAALDERQSKNSERVEGGELSLSSDNINESILPPHPPTIDNLTVPLDIDIPQPNIVPVIETSIEIEDDGLATMYEKQSKPSEHNRKSESLKYQGSVIASTPPLATNNFPLPKKPIHKRFGSEELEPISDVVSLDVVSLQPMAEDALGNDNSSEDEAPETVTASTGLEQTRIAAKEAAKAAKRQDLAQKEKRRKRDTELKKQAQLSKKPKKGHIPLSRKRSQADAFVPNTPPTQEADPGTTAAKALLRSHGPLPTYLPAEILASVPDVRVRSPTPPPRQPRPQANTHTTTAPGGRKRVFAHAADPKPPKDVRHGAVRVRVLAQHAAGLAPRVQKAARNVKAAWLVGRRKNGSGSKGSRVAVRRGFVRR